MTSHDVTAYCIEVVDLEEGEDWYTGESPVEWEDVVKETLDEGGREGERERERGRRQLIS